MVRGRSRVVDRGRFVSGCWGRFVSIIVGFTRVLDISDVSTISIINLVSDGLDSAIGKGNSVASRGSIPITRFSLTKVNSGVIILGSIGIVVDWGSIFIDWGRVTISGGRWASWG